MCQRRHAIELLTEAGIIRSKLSRTPLDQNLKLSKGEGELLPNPIIYKSVRMYISSCVFVYAFN